MEQGIFSGLFWATDTVLIHNVSLDNSTITILPVLIACLHDFISVLIISIILLLTTKIRYLIKDIKSKGSKYIALAAILGGPIGLTAYIISLILLVLLHHYIQPLEPYWHVYLLMKEETYFNGWLL